MTPSLDLSYTHGTVLLPLILWMERQSLQHTQKVVKEKRKKKKQAQDFWVFFLVMTNVQLNEISLYYSLELQSKAHHSNANIFCRRQFVCDSPRSDSGKSTFSFGLHNLPPIYLSSVLSSFLSPQTLHIQPHQTLNIPFFTYPDHILFYTTHFLICTMKVTVPNLTDTRSTCKKNFTYSRYQNKCELLYLSLQPYLCFKVQSTSTL